MSDGKLSRKSLEVFAGIITGDNSVTPYRTWNALGDFWDDLDIDTSECDFSEATSRLKNTLVVVTHYNRKKDFATLNKILFEVLSLRNFIDDQDKSPEEVVYCLNKYFEFDGFEVLLTPNSKACLIDKNSNQTIISENVEKLNHEFIEDQHLKIKEKIQTADYDGAIANARTLVEAIMQEILKKYGKSDDELEEDLDNLYKMLKKEMKLAVNKDANDVFKQILSGLQSLVSGFSSLGNKMSDRHSTRYRASKHHAELAVNSAYTISEFLLSSYEHQQRVDSDD